VRTFCVENEFERPVRVSMKQNSYRGVWQSSTPYVSRGDRACILRDTINRIGFENERIECYFNFEDQPSSKIGCGYSYFLRKDSDLVALHTLRNPSGSGGFSITSERTVPPPQDRRVRTVCIESDNPSPIRLVVSQNSPSGIWKNVTRYVRLGVRSCLDSTALSPAADGLPLQCQYNRAGFENYPSACSGENFILDRSSSSLGVYECHTLACRASTR